MLDAEVKRLVERLDPGTFTSFVGSLLRSEGQRIGLRLDNIILSDALTENDEGLDALLRSVPPDARGLSPIPAGNVGLQLKAVKRKQPSALKLRDELDKKGPKTILEAGGTYILVWSQDLNPA